MTQNFNHQNLRGSSFKGKDLTGVDFTGADVRGANFTNALLSGANFSVAQAGQQYQWIAGIAVIVMILAGLAGLLPAYAGGLVGLLIVPSPATEAYDRPEFFWISSILSLVVLAVCGLMLVRRGLGSTLGVFATTVVVAVAVVAWAGQGEAIVAFITQFVAIGTIIAGIVVGALAILVAWFIGGKFALFVVGVTAVLMVIPGVLEATRPATLPRSVVWISLGISGIITLFSFCVSIYISVRAIAGDYKYRFIQTLAVSLSSLGGTQFRGANLTDADFTGATLKSADFRKAILKRTCWYQAHKLDQARLEGSYLEDPDLRDLAIAKDGCDKTYDRLDLRGFNLENANLQNASFIGTDFSEATLRNARLSGAKLVQAQLYKADLTEACLTGTYIQDWGISVDTQLDSVQCDYIYMRLPTREDPDPCRKPDNRSEVFKEGDFADFIAPIITTLDLYRTQNLDLREMAGTFKTLDLFHYKGIDPAAAAVALQQVSEENPEAGLEIVALEGRGNQKIRLQAVVSGDVNRSDLSARYFDRYQEMKALSYEDLQSLLAGVAEKDERIHSLEKLLEDALQQPKFYVETYQHQGEFLMSQSKGNMNISGVHGNVSGIAAAGENQNMIGVAIGAISGSVTNTINQLPASTDPNTPGIKEFLSQLQAAIEAESELPDEDKAEALEQVKTLAEAGQKPEDNALQKAAKTSMKILKGTVASLPDAAKLAESCANLLPKIATLLALV